MKKFWKILIIVVVVIAIVLLGIFILNEFFFYDDYDNEEEYEDDVYEDEDEDENEDEDDYEDSLEESDELEAPSDSESEIAGNEPSTESSSLSNLIVLINFGDQKLSTTERDWADFYFGGGNSVKSYFGEMSKGSFKILAAEESFGTSNNGVIEITVDANHPNLTSESADDEYSSLTDIFGMLLSEVDEYIDFSQYDKNNDGTVLASELSITMIAAGFEENDYSTDYNQVAGICINEEYFFSVDDVYIGDYILCGELEMQEDGSQEMVTIGVACHETAHVLGLPDLYDTDYTSIGLGFHALMSEGNNNRDEGERLGETPSPLIAWSRMYVGFIEPKVVAESGLYTLYGQSTSNYNVIRINVDGGYYLIENVDFNGYGVGIAEYMDHSGIAIWYINEDVVTEDNILNNDINNDETNRGVILIEAAGKDELVGEALEYDNPDYNHYFAANDINEYTTDEGIIIKVIDNPGESMDIEIAFSN